MNANDDQPTRAPSPTPDRPVNRPATGLNLTPAEAEREAAKLHDLREDLEERKRTDDSDARTNPIGRHDE